MEFVGIEIKPGKPFKVVPEDGYVIHVSQVTLGESEKVKGETVQVYVKVGEDEQKHLLGNLSWNIPQVSLDLLFEKEFELSHECKSSSVFVLGYMSPMDEDDEELDSDEEDLTMDMFQKEIEKSNANAPKDQKAVVEAGESEDESDSDEMDSDDDEDESDEEEEEAPLKVEPPSKKRPNGGAMNNNTNASKKAKVGGVPQKPSGGHKGHKCGGVHPPKRK